MCNVLCNWGHGMCTAPDTVCPHWIGTSCELDDEYYRIYGKEIEEWLTGLEHSLS